MIIITWLLFGIFVGIIASDRGRNGFGWFCFSFLFSPLVGLIFVMCLSKKDKTNQFIIKE